MRQAAAGVFVGAALALFAGGTAQAAPAPTFHWCPGQPWDPGWGAIYDWDWNHCHDWDRAAGQGGPMGNGPWGSRRCGRHRSRRHRRGRREPT
jgi:hypothetical protein